MLIFIKAPTSTSKVKALYLTKHVENICLEKNAGDETCQLTYMISSRNENGFSMKHFDEEQFAIGSEIVLTIREFSIIITGDLAFYANVLGMPSSSSYWCPWCLLSRPQWQTLVIDQPTGNEHTAEFQKEMYNKLLDDSRKRLKAQDKKGVSTAMHYKSLTPQNFVPPMLHLEIGMVNLVWDTFELWIDNVAEMIPPLEQDTRKKLIEVERNLFDATEQKKEADRTVNIEIREKNAEIKALKSELKKTKHTEHERKLDLQTWIQLLTAFVDECKSQFARCKENVKDCQKQVTEIENTLTTLKAERGKPEASIVAEIELLLDNFRISRACYHGGDFNGVSCRRLVYYCNAIMEEVKKLYWQRKMRGVMRWL